MNGNKEYKQIQTPDVSKIAEIVLAAKGVERTMAKFSEDTGINPSTLSRIANGKIKKPLTIDVIDAIIEKSSPSCEYNKDALIRANGMIDPHKSSWHKTINSFYDRELITKDRLMKMRTIILNELYIRNVGFKKVALLDRKEDFILREFGRTPSRILLSMLESKNEKYWGFNLNIAMRDADDIRRGMTPANDSFFKDSMYLSYAKIMITDAWEPDLLNDIKCTFVFCDNYFYELFREWASKAKLHNNMTTILLNLDEGKVLKEESLPGCENFNQDNYFDLPIDEEDDESEGYYQNMFNFDEFDEE